MTRKIINAVWRTFHTGHALCKAVGGAVGGAVHWRVCWAVELPFPGTMSLTLGDVKRDAEDHPALMEFLQEIEAYE